MVSIPIIVWLQFTQLLVFVSYEMKFMQLLYNGLVPVGLLGDLLELWMCSVLLCPVLCHQCVME